jgi:hypothetical protein
MEKKDSLNHFFTSLWNAYKLLRDGHYSVFYNEIKIRLYSESLSLGLQRDLNKPFEAPHAKIKINIRPFKEGDTEMLLGESESAMTNPKILASQRAILVKKIPQCYVAVTLNNKPCYMQWLIGYKENDKIRFHFQDLFPPLKPREALLEGAYCNPEFRGLGIMPAAMSQIAENASLINARWVNTFVDVTNVASLKGCRRSGFEPYILRKNRWLLFHRTVSFHPLPAKMRDTYNLNTADNATISNNNNGNQTHL